MHKKTTLREPKRSQATDANGPTYNTKTKWFAPYRIHGRGRGGDTAQGNPLSRLSKGLQMGETLYDAGGTSKEDSRTHMGSTHPDREVCSTQDTQKSPERGCRHKRALRTTRKTNREYFKTFTGS